MMPIADARSIREDWNYTIPSAKMQGVILQVSDEAVATGDQFFLQWISVHIHDHALKFGSAFEGCHIV